FRRGALDDRRRDRGVRSGGCPRGRIVRPLPQPGGRELCRSAAFRHALRRRRPCRDAAIGLQPTCLPIVSEPEVCVMPSLWVAETEPLIFPPLEDDASCDLVVVGSGIARLSSADEAARCGAQVIVIERGDTARGMTARTTAHLTTEIDDRYFDLIRTAGEDNARLYHDSQVAAVSRIEAICEEEGIEADFIRLPGYLVAGEKADLNELNEEYDACRKLGVDVQLCTEAPLPLIEGTSALKFADQGRFHPLKYCADWRWPSRNATGASTAIPPMSIM